MTKCLVTVYINSVTGLRVIASANIMNSFPTLMN